MACAVWRCDGVAVWWHEVWFVWWYVVWRDVWCVVGQWCGWRVGGVVVVW